MNDPKNAGEVARVQTFHTFDFLHGYVFDVRRDVPLVAEGVGHAAAAVAVRLVRGRGD
jgi:hypothetical protein